MFKHLQNIKMGYWVHFFHSVKLSKILFVSSIKSFMHAIYPDVYVDSTSKLVKNLSIKLKFSKKEN